MREEKSHDLRVGFPRCDYQRLKQGPVVGIAAAGKELLDPNSILVIDCGLERP